MYHPDVNTTGDNYQPDADRFREIAEAYAVLSVPETKMEYDLNHTKLDKYVYKEARSAAMEANRKMRDRTGRAPAPKPMRGSYAEHRMKVLEKEREKHNVNHLGYYKGGIPQKFCGSVRKNSDGAPGAFHDPNMHNEDFYLERESIEVTPKTADQFRKYQAPDAETRRRNHPYYRLVEDPNWTYVKNRTFATVIMLGFVGYVIAKRIYVREKQRAHMSARQPDALANAPAHHFVNKGGVLVQKEVIGFARYFKNDKELTDWYTRVYPDLFRAKKV